MNTGLRVSNKCAFYALAVDDHRKIFAPTLWTVDYVKGTPPPHHHRTLEQVEQRWFVGAHANAGGGCLSDPLPQAPLQWIMGKATRHGLMFRRSLALDPLKPPPPISDSYSEFAGGAYKFVSRPYYRSIGADPIESSMTEMRENINETIDASIFERWREDPSYRPPNLKGWAQRRKIDPNTIMGSVSADFVSAVS